MSLHAGVAGWGLDFTGTAAARGLWCARYHEPQALDRQSDPSIGDLLIAVTFGNAKAIRDANVVLDTATPIHARSASADGHEPTAQLRTNGRRYMLGLKKTGQ